MRGSISSAVAALPRNETLKRGAYSLAIPDRLHRYQHVLSILPADQIDHLFQDGLLDANSDGALLDCWADMSDLISETDELGGFQFLEVRSTLPDELADVCRQTFHGAQP